MQKTSETIRRRVERLRRQGAVYSDIIKATGLAKSTVSLICNELRLTPEEEARVQGRKLELRPPPAPKPPKRQKKVVNVFARAKPRPLAMTPEVKAAYMSDYMLNRYRTRRRYVFDYFKNCCEVKGCQATGDKLTVVGREKGFRFGTVVGQSEERFLQALEEGKLRVICRTHLFEELRAPEHGNSYVLYYRKKCRCDDCCEWQANYILERKEARNNLLALGS